MTIDFSQTVTAEQKAAAATAAQRETEMAAARDYLQSTDWMAIREAEGVKPMPDDVREKRAEARRVLSL